MSKTEKAAPAGGRRSLGDNIEQLGQITAKATAPFAPLMESVNRVGEQIAAPARRLKKQLTPLYELQARIQALSNSLEDPLLAPDSGLGDNGHRSTSGQATDGAGEEGTPPASSKGQDSGLNRVLTVGRVLAGGSTPPGLSKAPKGEKQPSLAEVKALVDQARAEREQAKTDSEQAKAALAKAEALLAEAMKMRDQTARPEDAGAAKEQGDLAITASERKVLEFYRLFASNSGLFNALVEKTLDWAKLNPSLRDWGALASSLNRDSRARGWGSKTRYYKTHPNVERPFPLPPDALSTGEIFTLIELLGGHETGADGGITQAFNGLKKRNKRRKKRGKTA